MTETMFGKPLSDVFGGGAYELYYSQPPGGHPEVQTLLLL